VGSIPTASTISLVESPLFDELWRQRTEPEKAILRGSALSTNAV
jgi:hypothetical protein